MRKRQRMPAPMQTPNDQNDNSPMKTDMWSSVFLKSYIIPTVWKYFKQTYCLKEAAMVGIFIALISGALMSIQGVFNTEVTKDTSMWVSNSWVQFSAFIVCLCAWLFTGRESFAGLMKVEPKYMLIGGVLGAFITFTVVKSMESLGPARAVMLIVISQLIVAYLIELFGIFGVDRQPFEWRKAIGMALSIAGIILFKWE